MRCSNCGSANRMGAHYCGNCGCPLVLTPEAELIADRTRDFTGRTWVLDEVAEWLDKGQERFLFITGEPGSGKTALAAWLAIAGPPPDDAEAQAPSWLWQRRCAEA